MSKNLETQNITYPRLFDMLYMYYWTLNFLNWLKITFYISYEYNINLGDNRTW